MIEGKIQFTERLRKEGRWGEASSSRTRLSNDCIARELKRNEANDLAWEEMSKRSPQLASVKPAVESEGETGLNLDAGTTRGT